MNVTFETEYLQIMDLVKQLSVNQMEKLIAETKIMLEEETIKNDIPSFQEFLLTAPTMSDQQYELFLENRKTFNQWRTK